MVINTNIEILIRLVLATVFGAVIGYEREKRRIAAGLRTHMLVCVGAALITLTSIFAFQGADPSRIAAGIVTGVGFLAAGSIFRDKNRIRGLTTAADLWVIAGIGMALGAGFYYGAIITMILLGIIIKLRILEKKRKITKK